MTRLVVLVALALFAIPASACPTFPILAAFLQAKYAETPAYVAITHDSGAVMTIFNNQATGTWTVVMQASADAACVMSYGDGFEAASEPVAHPPAAGIPDPPPIRPQRLPGAREWRYLTPARLE